MSSAADFHYDLEEVLASSWHMDGTRQIDRLFRYQRVVANKVEFPAIEFSGARVLELGCGPLLGWGPIAAYLGCRSYLCIDPNLNPAVIGSSRVRDRYLFPLYQQLDAIFSAGVAFDEFLHRTATGIDTRVAAFEDCELPKAAIDLVISNGVLQHVKDLPGFIHTMRNASKPEAQHFHVVNFADHPKDPRRPFATMYSMEPEEYLRQSDLLNLKRPSELAALFAAQGLEMRFVPYYTDPDIIATMKAQYWKRFNDYDLSIQMGFFIR